MSGVERVLSRVLFLGGVLSIALMLFGLLGFAVRSHDTLEITGMTRHREAGRAVGVFTSISAVRRALDRRPVDPLAVAAVGILLLLVTPIVAVMVAVPAFIAAGDGRYALIAGLLAALLVGSLVFGGSG